MKKLLLPFICLLFVPFLVYGQTVIYNFDTIPDTSEMIIDDGPAGDKTYLNVTLNTTNVHEGTGAIRLDWQNRCYDQWGGWIGLNFYHPDEGGVYDFSPYEQLSLWYYVESPLTVPREVHFRIILWDAGEGGSTADGQQEVWMAHFWILDNAPGWNEIVVTLADSGDAMAPWLPKTGNAFWNPGWGQSVAGNDILDLDKIRGWRFEFSQEANLWQQPADTVSGVLLLDYFTLLGVRPVNLIFFNGKTTPSNVNMFVGWSGAAEITDEEAFTPGTNSVKWTCGSGWDGVNFGMSSPKNLSLNWPEDSVQFKIKANAGLGNLLLVFHDVDEDGAVKEDYAFQAAYTLSEASMGWDGTWKKVKVALADFNLNNGCWDNDLGRTVAGVFDPSRVEKFTIGGTGQAFEGMIVYLDDIWTGNPEFDWIPPAQVTNVRGVPANDYNLVIWEDVPGEAGEKYNVYASKNPITDINAPTIELVEEMVLEGTQTAVHWIFAPLYDTDLAYYYAVECVDESGNVGPFGASAAVTNTAKGVPIISLNPPANFTADADLSEWEASGIKPWVLTPEFNKVNSEVTDSLDLKATVYLAMDQDYLYVAFDVIDDVFSYAPEGDWWRWDAFEFYIGLYNQVGGFHTDVPWNNRGAEPDYKLVFQYDRFFNDFDGGAGNVVYTNADENYYFEEFGGADYACEAKIPFDVIAFGNDVRFNPVHGMRVPFELYFHDNDGTDINGWQGNLGWSEKNTDNAWQWVREWTLTWIIDENQMAIDENPEPAVPQYYDLSQNYPNPFNPATTITYSLPEASQVTIELFNTLGQKLRTIVDERKIAGRYTVTVTADDLTSGIYFYSMQAGSFKQTKKMILMK